MLVYIYDGIKSTLLYDVYSLLHSSVQLSQLRYYLTILRVQFDILYCAVYQKVEM
jgi:hypothetical protein